MDGKLYVVRGRKIVEIRGSELRQAAFSAQHVVIDVGTGDGRWIYRLGRSHPQWCCIGVDANAAGMREVSWRATRRTERGGAPNVWFIRAAAEALPEALFSIADEIHVQYPWGSLRRILLLPDPEGLAALAAIGKPGAIFRITLNVLPEGNDNTLPVDAVSYGQAGLELQRVDLVRSNPESSWGKRLGHRGPKPILVIEGRIARQHDEGIRGVVWV